MESDSETTVDHWYWRASDDRYVNRQTNEVLTPQEYQKRQLGDGGPAPAYHRAAPENPTTPVPGYRPQSDKNLAVVKVNKEMEERLLRRLGLLAEGDYDGRWLAIARTHLEIGFMAMNRAVMQPDRVRLPEDAP